MIHYSSWLYFSLTLHFQKPDWVSLGVFWNGIPGHLKLILFYSEYHLNIFSGVHIPESWYHSVSLSCAPCLPVICKCMVVSGVKSRALRLERWYLHNDNRLLGPGFSCYMVLYAGKNVDSGDPDLSLKPRSSFMTKNSGI